MIRALLLLPLVACAVDIDDGVLDAPSVDTVSWQLSWDDAGIQRTESGWSTVSDRGATVHIERGWLTTATVSLVACDDIVAYAHEPADLLGDLLGIGTAYAGHPGDLDPSAWTTGCVEDLVAAKTVDLDPLAVGGQRYCRAHWAADAAWEGTDALPDDRLIGATLVLVGSVALPSGRTRPLSVNGQVGWGSLQDLSLADAPDGGDLHVRVVRPLATLFDGIDFTDPDAEVDTDVLRNLADGLSFQASIRADP